MEEAHAAMQALFDGIVDEVGLGRAPAAGGDALSGAAAKCAALTAESDGLRRQVEALVLRRDEVYFLYFEPSLDALSLRSDVVSSVKILSLHGLNPDPQALSEGGSYAGGGARRRGRGGGGE